MPFLTFFLKQCSIAIICLGIVTVTSIAIAEEDNDLPALGDASSAIISPQQEYIAGQQWLRAFRRQANIEEDPLIYSYLQELIQTLSVYSQLQSKQFSLLVVDSNAFNAFAVPGNVVGINTGLFNFARSEDQLASVISHELAHLSQRHFARRKEQQQRQNLKTMAALLGSLIIMATAGTEEGLAALTATQAAAIENQLRYSRLHEQEADRIGIQTLAAAGMNPNAAANMFQHMLAYTRYNENIRQFDFMLTHPLTDSRVSDAFNQAKKYPTRADKDSLHFQLIKTYIKARSFEKPAEAVTFFKSAQKDSNLKIATNYGLALSYLRHKKPKKAKPLVDDLLAKHPYFIEFMLLHIDLLASLGSVDEAFEQAQQYLELSPLSYPLSIKIADMALKFHQTDKGIAALEMLTEQSGYPDTPDIWYYLAELNGLRGNIAQVHITRAEYYQRIGAYKKALQHLHLALPLLETEPKAIAKTQKDIADLKNMQRSSPF